MKIEDVGFEDLKEWAQENAATPEAFAKYEACMWHFVGHAGDVLSCTTLDHPLFMSTGKTFIRSGNNPEVAYYLIEFTLLDTKEVFAYGLQIDLETGKYTDGIVIDPTIPITVISTQ